VVGGGGGVPLKRFGLMIFCFNSLTAIGPYMAHRCSWASFKLKTFQFFVHLLCLINQNLAELFNLNSGIRIRVRGSRAKDMSRGSVMGLEIV
jgi:hypothetical protein